MSLISHLSLRKDEDFPAIKKKKSRNPKPRDKWSLLWFIPSNVLNMREETTDGKGQTVKKGKRHGFDTFNQLGCNVCRKAFHKYQSLSFHTREENHGRLNPAGSRSNASWNNVAASRSVQTPAATKRNSLELMRTYSEPSRKSNRLSIKPISYDDEVEILEVDDTPYKTKKLNNHGSAKEIDEKKFGKLTLSAKRKIVEDFNNREEEELENKKVQATKKVHAKKYVKPIKMKSSKSIVEIEVIDIDDEPKAKKIVAKAKPVDVETTKMEDEELLLAEDDDVMDEVHDKKRKPICKLQTPNMKKVKVQTDKEKTEDMVEVKSSSGKSMFVNKATLEKILASKALKKASAVSKRSSLDEKLLAEKSDVDVVKRTKKSLSVVDYSLPSPKKTRSRGL